MATAIAAAGNFGVPARRPSERFSPPFGEAPDKG